MSFVFNPFRQGRFPLRLILTVVLSGYLLYHLFHGNRGLLSLFEIRRVVITERALQQDLRARSKQLRKKIELLRPKSLDVDLLDEQARSVLNMASSDEIVIDTDEILAGYSSVSSSSVSLSASSAATTPSFMQSKK